MSSYIKEQEFRDYVKTDSTDQTDTITAAIAAASRSVDVFCGRWFDQREGVNYTSVSANDSSALWLLPTDDIATTEDLVVSTDVARDGSFSQSWTIDADFILEPINQQQAGISPWPYTYLRAIGSLTWPVRYRPWERDLVKIEGTFGWPTAVPDEVKQATRIIAAQLWKLGEAPFGVAGWGAYGDIKVREIPQAATLLAPYRKVGSFGVA